MLVGKRMTRNVATITPGDYLATARVKMEMGGFRRLPVVTEGKLVGIITDRDLRQHTGYLERTKVNAAMTEKVVTVAPQTTLEEATQLMLTHKIGGLPVVEKDQLVGIITASDILQTFLDVMGASETGTARIDLLLEDDGFDLTGASKTVADEGGEILGIGMYRERWGNGTACYLRLRATDPERLAGVLKEKGYEVLGVHF
jgi:acetoin utilization protein AcuB